MPRKNISGVLARRTGELMAVPGVVGVGEGVSRGTACIMVFVAKKDAEALRRIPDSLDGYPVRVEASGEFGALNGS